MEELSVEVSGDGYCKSVVVETNDARAIFEQIECIVDSELSETNVDEFVEESRFSRDEAIDVLKQEISKRESAGRPSKVEKWEKKIENNGASLSDAKEELSRSTWYKLKKRVEQ